MFGCQEAFRQKESIISYLTRAIVTGNIHNPLRDDLEIPIGTGWHGGIDHESPTFLNKFMLS